MAASDLAGQPGFRRRFLVVPSDSSVLAAVEDDYHCMSVTLRHDGESILSVDAHMDRVPWTTCPGAPAVLGATFTGTALGLVTQRGQKPTNCTHLYDLAVLAAAHALDRHPLHYDILVTDAVDGEIVAEIRLDDQLVHRLVHRDDIVSAPSAIQGLSLFKLRGWIESLTGTEQEAARLLQWGTILAHGRAIPMDRQSDASRMPPNCYSFQEDMKKSAKRVGEVIDFSQGRFVPLGHLGEQGFSRRTQGDA